jgi:hypothetical protein
MENGRLADHRAWGALPRKPGAKDGSLSGRDARAVERLPSVAGARAVLGMTGGHALPACDGQAQAEYNRPKL